MTRTQSVDSEADSACLEVRELRAQGLPLSAAAEVHVAECALCSRSTLGRSGAGANESELNALFAAVQQEITAGRGLRVRLQELPTGVRVLVAAITAAVLVSIIGITMPRSRFAPMPVERVTLVVGVLAVLLVGSIRLGLRPLQAPPPSGVVTMGCFLGGLLAPSLFAFGPFPTLFEGAPGGHGFVRSTLACFALGGIAAALIVTVLRALDRGAHGSRRSALLAAAAGGLAGNASLELHCPSTAPAHLLLGHASIGLVFAFVYGWLWTRQREQRGRI